MKDARFQMVATYGMPSGFKQYVLDHPMDIDRGSVSGRAALDGRTIHIRTWWPIRNSRGWTPSNAADFRTALGVPLMREGAPIGTIF